MKTQQSLSFNAITSRTSVSSRGRGSRHVPFNDECNGGGKLQLFSLTHNLTRFFFPGLIRLRSDPLPKLQGLEYFLNVTATDDNSSGGPQSLSSTAGVIVGVDDVNNNKPVFQAVGRC